MVPSFFGRSHNIRGGVENTRLEAKTKNTKKSEAKESPPRADPLEAKDQGHRRKCSQKIKKKFFKKFLRRSQKKKTFPKKFSGDQQNFNNSINTAVLEPRKDRTIFKEMRLRGQGLDSRCQGLQNVSSKTSSRPRTSLDSTSA